MLISVLCEAGLCGGGGRGGANGAIQLGSVEAMLAKERHLGLWTYLPSFDFFLKDTTRYHE